MLLRLIEKYTLIVSKLEYKHILTDDEIKIIIYKVLHDLQLPLYIEYNKIDIDEIYSKFNINTDDIYVKLSNMLYTLLHDNLNFNNYYILHNIKIKCNIIIIDIRSKK